MYRHYSFDLWLTLIRSNPAFKQERAIYFHKYYNSREKPLEEVVRVFREVDLLCNAINEKTGGNITAEEMYLIVISKLNDHSLSFHDIDLKALLAKMETLLFDYLPVVYCTNTPGVLSQLKSREDVTLSILSNTGFIKGQTLRKVLDHLELSPFFDFQLYSDELGMSKPNKAFFDHLIQHVTSCRNGALEAASIIHIGDNPIADIEGAKSVGIKSLLVNSNNVSILTLLN